MKPNLKQQVSQAPHYTIVQVYTEFPFCFAYSIHAFSHIIEMFYNGGIYLFLMAFQT